MGTKLQIYTLNKKQLFKYNMNASEIRQTFLDFFEGKQHKIVPSAPIVVKDDPTLMFTNAGMNPFKDYFLGNKVAEQKRVADTQKCLRVSGKHNDLEEVGVDTYHHTMFEMLGNWSFGDYFKEEAINWAWELLTEVYKLPKDRLYASYFGGDEKEKLTPDEEAKALWGKLIPADRILPFDKSDNFWEMGDTGPCGPCSEIHVDLRPDSDRQKVDGASLVNMDHPLVVEIWNLVFIQFNRKADQSLEELPEKHVDTGMGFERLCMAIQKKESNYDTDVFQPMIQKVAEITSTPYGKSEETDIALRVISDHLRAVSFAIADGQRPENNGAGYVIRRILRRAVRYAYSVLDYKKPVLVQLFPTLVENFGHVFPEIKKDQDYIGKVILGEEEAFLRTIESGIKRFDKIKDKDIDGKTAFELYDTYGFPLDLTELMARESGIAVDTKGFDVEMDKQKKKAQEAGKVEAGDWMVVNEGPENEFVGYDELEVKTKISRHRTAKAKGKEIYQVILQKTPFYAESGGQVGDTGLLIVDGEKIAVLDTQKENDLIVLFIKKLPKNPAGAVTAQVNKGRRQSTASNHTATHLVHAALRQILGDHVHQKGSLVSPDYLRFDFAHFSKVEAEELAQIEQIVNQKIRENIALEENRSMPFKEAIASGAMALFGEKYGDEVRLITFGKDFSQELCGGTHVQATGELGFCKITTETSVASGVRRVEAVTGSKAYDWVTGELAQLNDIRGVFKSPQRVVQQVQTLTEDNKKLQEELSQFQSKAATQIKNDLKANIEIIGEIKFVGAVVEVGNADLVKQMAFDLQREVPNLFAVIGAQLDGKAHLSIMMDKALAKNKGVNASQMIREIAKFIQGGGGGQDFYATAGGKKPEGLQEAIDASKEVAKTIG